MFSLILLILLFVSIYSVICYRWVVRRATRARLRPSSHLRKRGRPRRSERQRQLSELSMLSTPCRAGVGVGLVLVSLVRTHLAAAVHHLLLLTGPARSIPLPFVSLRRDRDVGKYRLLRSLQSRGTGGPDSQSSCPSSVTCTASGAGSGTGSDSGGGAVFCLSVVGVCILLSSSTSHTSW